MIIIILMIIIIINRCTDHHVLLKRPLVEKNPYGLPAEHLIHIR